MKRIRLYAYWGKNLGDDLMVHVLLKRYPNLHFFSNEWNRSSARFASYSNYDNWDSLSVKYGRINHLMNIPTLHKKQGFFMEAVRKAYANCCASVLIGGSVYMESDVLISEHRKNALRKQECSPLYVIGANFGPYHSDAFKAFFDEYFQTVGGVTFRDKKSYALFRENPKATYAPDVVFNLDISGIEHVEQDNTVLISVIDMAGRADLSAYSDQYDHLIASLCDTIVKQGKTPLLMSFCKGEGDETAIERIMQRLPEDIREKTNRYDYHGDIHEALTVIQRTECVIATRFHAMILALKFGKPFFSISYNEKVRNVLQDISCDSYCEISELQNLTASDVLEKCRKWDVREYAAQAAEQFAQFDRFLKSKQ